MSCNVVIRTDNCDAAINHFESKNNIEINTENDVLLTTCVNVTIKKARNVFVDFSQSSPLAYPKMESVQNIFVINPWNVQIQKCVSSQIEVDKKYEVVELAANCDSLRKIIFTGSPLFANTAHVLVKKGIKFDGIVENGGIRFEDEQQWCAWATHNHYRIGLTAAEMEKLSKYHYNRQEYTRSFWYAEKGAAAGSQKCAFRMANLWMQGWGVERDPFLGFAMYELLALKGYAPSQHNLGVCYLNGEGVEYNEESGLFWIEQAALQGYPPAQDLLNSY